MCEMRKCDDQVLAMTVGSSLLGLSMVDFENYSSSIFPHLETVSRPRWRATYQGPGDRS